MTLILALLVLFGIGKAVEQISCHTAVVGNYAFTYSVPKGFRNYRPGVTYFCCSAVNKLKLNWQFILLIAIVLIAYHLSSLEEIGGLASMTMLTTTGNKVNPHLEKLSHMWKVAANKSRFFETVSMTKNPLFVQKYPNIAVTIKTWDFHNSCVNSVEGNMDEIPCNYFTDRFQGDIWFLPGLWNMKFKLRQAFLDSLYSECKKAGKYFHMSEKTSECYFYVGTREQFEEVVGCVPKASKFKKTVAAMASVVDRYSIIGLPETVELTVVDSAKCGLRKHVGDGQTGIFRKCEYHEGRTYYNIGASQNRITGKLGDIAKCCISWDIIAALVWEDIKENIDANLPTTDGYIFMENIKGGFDGLKHGDILNVKSEDIICLKKAKAPGTNTSALGGQLQISTICQSKEFKSQLLAKSPVHRVLGLMKDVWNTGSLDAMWELGFNRGDDLDKILSRLFFDDLRDTRSTQVHKTSIYRKFVDKVRKAEHSDRSWSAYGVGLIQIGLAEQYHYEKTGEVKHFALTPHGCDIESLIARYPATSNHSCVAITPVQQLPTHDVVIMAASTKTGWLSFNEAGFGDWDGDMFAVYRGLVEGYKNFVPALTEIPTDKVAEPENYIDGIIGASNAAVIAKASISESDRAVRFGFMLLFVNMYEGRVKLSVDMLAKLVQDTASMRETFIKSQKRTEVNGKQVSIEQKILSMFPQVMTSELGKEVAEILFYLTTADAGATLSAEEYVKMDAVVAKAKELMQPKYAKYHGILNSFPFIKTIASMSEFATQDYEQLDTDTLNSMYKRGKAIINRYTTEDVNVGLLHRSVNRIGWLVNHFNNCIKHKDISTLAEDNPLFKDITVLPDNEERWIIQADGVRRFMEKTIEGKSMNDIMVLIGMIITGWDNSKVDKFEGFGVYHTPSGYEFRRRGWIFWMLPKSMLAKAAFAVAERDDEGNILNPFLRNAATPEDVEALLDNYVTENEEENSDMCYDTDMDDAEICLNFI